MTCKMHKLTLTRERLIDRKLIKKNLSICKICFSLGYDFFRRKTRKNQEQRERDPFCKSYNVQWIGIQCENRRKGFRCALETSSQKISDTGVLSRVYRFSGMRPVDSTARSTPLAIVTSVLLNSLGQFTSNIVHSQSTSLNKHCSSLPICSLDQHLPSIKFILSFIPRKIFVENLLYMTTLLRVKQGCASRVPRGGLHCYKKQSNPYLNNK